MKRTRKKSDTDGDTGILHQGLPLEMTLGAKKIPNASEMTREELDDFLREGLQDFEEGRAMDVGTAFGFLYERIK